MYINDVTFAGNAGKDADDYTSPNGTRVVTFTICHSEKAKNAEFVEQSVWLRVKVFGSWTEMAATIKKGDNVIVKGRLQENRWKDKETGKERLGIECVAYQLGVIKNAKKELLANMAFVETSKPATSVQIIRKPSTAAIETYEDETTLPF